MEDLKNLEKLPEIEKVNKAVSDLPEVPRDDQGRIDLEAITTGTDEKGNKIVPDEIMDKYYKELPAGTINQSGTWRASCNGKLKILGGDPERDKSIHKAGGEALQATLKQRRSIKEILEELSRNTVTAEEAEEYQLKEGTTLLEAANLAQIRRAMKGDTKAAEYVRDTLGEKPSEKISAEITALTPEDNEMIQRVQARLDNIPQ